MTLPGLVNRGEVQPQYLRLIVYGNPGVGKTIFAATFPAPVFLHTTMESGYDSFAGPHGSMFDFAQLGATMPIWLEDPKQGRRFTAELDEWVSTLAMDLHRGRCRYQTVVLGGFSMMQQLVISECFALSKDKQRAWGDVAEWMRKLLQTLCTLPVHVIFEVGAKDMQKDRTGNVLAYEPMLSGSGGKNLEYNVSAMMWVERGRGAVLGYLHDLPHARTKVRLMPLWTTEPLINPSYDWFAARMGLPHLMQCDPGHPRCQPGVWPWPHDHA